MLDKVISFTLYICAGIKYYFNAETKANNSPDTFVRKEKEEPLTLLMLYLKQNQEAKLVRILISYEELCPYRL